MYKLIEINAEESQVDPDTGDLIGYGYSIGGPMDKKVCPKRWNIYQIANISPCA